MRLEAIITALAILSFSILLKFPLFLPIYLVLLGLLYFLKEWRVIPIISLLNLLVVHTINPNFILITLSLPIMLLSERVKGYLIPSILFALSLGLFLADSLNNLMVFIATLSFSIMVSMILDYRGVVIAGISFLILSVFFSQYMNISYFYLLNGVIAIIVYEAWKKRNVKPVDIALSIVSIILPLAYSYLGIPLVLISIGLGLFFPPSILASLVLFYIEGFKYSLYLLPIIIIPYLWKSRVINFTLISLGLSLLFPYSIPLLFILAKYKKGALLYSALAFLAFSIISLLALGNYNLMINASIASLASSAVYLSFDYVLKSRRYIRHIVFYTSLGLVVASAVLVLFYYYYSFSYIALAASLGLFTYVNYDRIVKNIELLKFGSLILLSFLFPRYPFLPLSGYYLKNKWNVVAVGASIVVISLFYLHSVDLALISLFSSLSYFLQSLSVNNVKVVSYLPSVAIIALDLKLKSSYLYLPFFNSNLLLLIEYSVLAGLLSAITVLLSKFIGERNQYLGVVYSISLALILGQFMNSIGL
ncbi:MAG: hypothetical protein OWQ54_05530 [Sulfolobaceae archaeon]|nr:hypothetical protein [Sulfolobaceae archaeon]